MRRTPSLLLAAFVATSFALPALVHAAEAADKYQVTGVVTELTAEKVVLTKANGEKWELKRDPAAATDSALKMNEKVTIYYTMTVAKVDVKTATTKPTKPVK